MSGRVLLLRLLFVRILIYCQPMHSDEFRENFKDALSDAGIAGTLLTKGMTVYNALGLPVPLLLDFSSNIAGQSYEGQFLRQTDVFIWDEALMAPRYASEIMDRTLKDIMSNDLLFGGKIVILGRDFRALLPILPPSIRNEVINLSIKSRILWNVFYKFKLI